MLACAYGSLSKTTIPHKDCGGISRCESNKSTRPRPTKQPFKPERDLISILYPAVFRSQKPESVSYLWLCVPKAKGVPSPLPFPKVVYIGHYPLHIFLTQLPRISSLDSSNILSPCNHTLLSLTFRFYPKQLYKKKNVTVVVKVLNVSLPCLFAGKWLSLGFSWWVFLQWSPPFMGMVEDGLTLMPPSTVGVTLPGQWVCTTSTGISSLLSL
jgi:hypothetical protein